MALLESITPIWHQIAFGSGLIASTSCRTNASALSERRKISTMSTGVSKSFSEATTSWPWIKLPFNTGLIGITSHRPWSSIIPSTSFEGRWILSEAPTSAIVLVSVRIFLNASSLGFSNFPSIRGILIVGREGKTCGLGRVGVGYHSRSTQEEEVHRSVWCVVSGEWWWECHELQGMYEVSTVNGRILELQPPHVTRGFCARKGFQKMTWTEKSWRASPTEIFRDL